MVFRLVQPELLLLFAPQEPAGTAFRGVPGVARWLAVSGPLGHAGSGPIERSSVQPGSQTDRLPVHPGALAISPVQGCHLPRKQPLLWGAPWAWLRMEVPVPRCKQHGQEKRAAAAPGDAASAARQRKRSSRWKTCVRPETRHRLRAGSMKINALKAILWFPGLVGY